MPRANSTITPATPANLGSNWIAPLNGQRVVDIAATTLDAGEELVNHWRELKPIVERLTAQVRELVDEGLAVIDKESGTTKHIPLSGPEALKVLTAVSGVVDKIAKAAQSMIRSSESQSRLAVLLSGGVPKRVDAAALSESKLVGVVVETAKRLMRERGVCPVCGGTAPVVVDITPPAAEPVPS